MIFFITVLRALAACLITNSHYTGIYPSDIIANGGLLGDIIFFAVSGYCLVNVKATFPRWYGKRLRRIYPAVLIATIIYLLLGQYSLQTNNLFWWLGYPTNYHFVASIIVLYIPFYFVGKYDILRKNIPYIMLGVCVIYLAVYFFFYDKSYYHIDTVREPMIRFLFFESMLLGAYFREKNEKYQNSFNWWILPITIFIFIVYFISKIFFSRYPEYSAFQIINQFLILVLLYFIFRLFAALDNKLEKLPGFIKKCMEFISKITLEIYVVQYVLIEVLRPYFFFPVNWVVVTFSILISATLLNLLCKGLEKGLSWIAQKVKRDKKSKEDVLLENSRY